MLRRTFLQFFGKSVAGLATLSALGPLAAARAESGSSPASSRGMSWGWESVPYPVPLPGDDVTGRIGRAAVFELRDTLVVPDGFEWRTVAAWGDSFRNGVEFGFNCDYIGIVPRRGHPGELWIVVNHEYISARPWTQGFEKVKGRPLPAEIRYVSAAGNKRKSPRLSVDGRSIDGSRIDLSAHPDESGFDASTVEAARAFAREAIDDLGVTILHAVVTPDGTIETLRDSTLHRRIGFASVKNISAKPSFSGPAAKLLGTPRGTVANCSGGTTPWGTVLTCEENFQDHFPLEVNSKGMVIWKERPLFGGANVDSRTGLPESWDGLGTYFGRSLDPREYGWVTEIDPETGAFEKHTSLGRFLHENVAIRCVAGERLALYMGDDRPGGHVWKFVSREVVVDPKDSANSALLRHGTLYVARFDAELTGRWIPIEPETPVRRPAPERTASKHLFVPSRPGGGAVSVGAPGAEFRETSSEDWCARIEKFAGKPFDTVKLGDLVRGDTESDPRAVLMLDAFLMANAVGGTPTARPEDLEVHPVDRSVYIAFTDCSSRSMGSPDLHVFPDSAGQNSRQYGAIFRLEEEGGRPESTTFSWGRFIRSGEVSEGGAGFACADNLAFDPQGNLWVACDISTTSLNFPVTREGETTPGTKNFKGVFGNNALFMIPTSGPRAGLPHCFATAPMEAEIAGLAFAPDGESILLSIQHPGESNGVRPGGAEGVSKERFVIAEPSGRRFEQIRTVPIGSNFPSGLAGAPAKPAVVQVMRKHRA